MMFTPEISQLPGQIEAAFQFLRFAEEVRNPRSFDGSASSGRELSKTEFEVNDSALTLLLEYFNQPVPPTDHRHPAHPHATSEQANDTPH